MSSLAENNEDKRIKGRIPCHRGDANPNSRLTGQDVSTIRDLRNQGMTQQFIADQFKISQNHVNRIVRGLAWKFEV